MSGLLLFVDTGTSRTPVEVGVTSTVGDVLAQLPTNRRSRLTFQGQVLAPDALLSDTGVSSQAVLELESGGVFWEEASRFIEISENSELATKNVPAVKEGQHNFQTVRTNEVTGKVYCTLRVNKISWACFGVATKDYDLEDYAGYIRNKGACTYWNSAGPGYQWDGAEKFVQPFEAKDKLRIIVDTVAGTAAYYKEDAREPTYVDDTLPKGVPVCFIYTLGGGREGEVELLEERIDESGMAVPRRVCSVEVTQTESRCGAVNYNIKAMLHDNMSLLYFPTDRRVVKATLSGGVPLQAWRRYSDFCRFRDSFPSGFGADKLKSHFPGKTLGKASAEVVEKRRVQFEAWLEEIIQVSAAYDSIPKHIGDELQSLLVDFVGEQGHAASPCSPHSSK
eukprot:Hpha_TRINITY_DN34638_c0_g1::TRINITY_DN34638_c0_g1_i1::g.21081::m.21081